MGVLIGCPKSKTRSWNAQDRSMGSWVLDKCTPPHTPLLMRRLYIPKHTKKPRYFHAANDPRIERALRTLVVSLLPSSRFRRKSSQKLSPIKCHSRREDPQASLWIHFWSGKFALQHGPLTGSPACTETPRPSLSHGGQSYFFSPNTTCWQTIISAYLL